ncbi:MAG TPA: hypothetical protein VEU51_16665 [Candidatus Acidoferrales bacterium]|nr:hypothetical protein [Candidatus Acidoferrales bacterium]
MFAKISLTAAFFLMVAPPMAGASMRVQNNPAREPAVVSLPARGVVVAQEQQEENENDAESDNDNDSNDNNNENENQSGDNSQSDQQNADVGGQIPSQQFNTGDGQPGQAIRVPPLRGYPGQMDPNE